MNFQKIAHQDLIWCKSKPSWSFFFVNSTIEFYITQLLCFTYEIIETSWKSITLSEFFEIQKFAKRVALFFISFIQIPQWSLLIKKLQFFQLDNYFLTDFTCCVIFCNYWLSKIGFIKVWIECDYFSFYLWNLFFFIL